MRLQEAFFGVVLAGYRLRILNIGLHNASIRAGAANGFQVDAGLFRNVFGEGTGDNAAARFRIIPAQCCNTWQAPVGI